MAPRAEPPRRNRGNLGDRTHRQIVNRFCKVFFRVTNQRRILAPRTPSLRNSIQGKTNGTLVGHCSTCIIALHFSREG